MADDANSRRRRRQDDDAEADTRRSAVADDTGVPHRLVHWAILVGLFLSVAGAGVIIITDKAAQLGVLTTCVGFGIILAAFGSRASGGWQKLTATGAGALAIALFLLYQQYAPAPVEFKKPGLISGDINKVADLRIVDEHPLYTFRDRSTRTLRFIILDRQFRNPQLTIQVETNEKDDDKQFFEMTGDGETIVKRYFANPSTQVIKWVFDYETRTIKDGDTVIFRVPDRLDERHLGADPRPDAWLRVPALIGRAFAGIVEPREVPRLIADLKSDNPIVRRNARDDLVAAGPEGVRPMMAAWRASADEYRVKLGVVFALNGMLREKGSANKAIAGLLSDADIKLLVDAANDDDKTVRLFAAEFLFKLRDPRVVAPAVQAVREQRNADGVYNSVLILKPVFGDLQPSEQTRLKSELLGSIPSGSPRTRSLVEQLPAKR